MCDAFDFYVKETFDKACHKCFVYFFLNGYFLIEQSARENPILNANV